MGISPSKTPRTMPIPKETWVNSAAAFTVSPKYRRTSSFFSGGISTPIRSPYFQGQIGAGNEIYIVASDMQQMDWKSRWQRQSGERHADQIGLGDEDADIVERRAVLDDAPGFELPQAFRGLGDGAFLLGDDHQAISGSHRKIIGWNDVLMGLADHRHLDVTAQILGKIFKRPPCTIVTLLPIDRVPPGSTMVRTTRLCGGGAHTVGARHYGNRDCRARHFQRVFLSRGTLFRSSIS
jgi:hypothetical protein